MNPTVVQVLLVVFHFALGLGAAWLMYFMLPEGKGGVKFYATVLGWFVGSGGLVGMFWGSNWSEIAEIPSAEFVVPSAYLGGLGLGLVGIPGIQGWLARRDHPLVRALHEVLSKRQIELLLTVLGKSQTLAEAARRLGISVEEAEREYKDALRELKKLGERAFGKLVEVQKARAHKKPGSE
jgi:hypothetical protein